MNTAVNYVNDCKSIDWPNGLERKMLEELWKWTQPSDLTAMFLLRAELSKARMKRKYDPELLSSALSAIENKNKDLELR